AAFEYDDLAVEPGDDRAAPPVAEPGFERAVDGESTRGRDARARQVEDIAVAAVMDGDGHDRGAVVEAQLLAALVVEAPAVGAVPGRPRIGRGRGAGARRRGLILEDGERGER